MAAVVCATCVGCATQEDTGEPSVGDDGADGGNSAGHGGSSSAGTTAGASASSSGGAGGSSPRPQAGSGGTASSMAGSGGSLANLAGAAGSSATTGGSAGAPSGGSSSGGKGGSGGTASVEPDTTAPSTPGSLEATAITSISVTVTWTASTDNVAVTGYRLFNGGTQVTTVTGTIYTFKGLSAGKAYTFGVEAYDAAENTSARATKAASTTGAPACDANSAVATLVHGQSYTASSSACIQLTVNPAWNPVDIVLEQTAGNALSYSYKSCTGNGNGTISPVVHLFTGNNPACNFFVQLTGSGTVAYYD